MFNIWAIFAYRFGGFWSVGRQILPAGHAVRLLHPSTPRHDVDVHLLGPGHDLLEDALLPLQFRPLGYHRVEELNLGKKQALRLQMQHHSIAIIIDELFEPQENDAAQRAPVFPVDANLQLPGLVQLDGEALVPGLQVSAFTAYSHPDVADNFIPAASTVASWFGPRCCCPASAAPLFRR